MRFSTVATVCAAPLALASAVRDGLFAKREAVEIAQSSTTEVKGSTSNSKDSSSANVNVFESAITSSTEIIVIWVNNGGGAATSTVNPTVAAVTAAAAAATHQVVVGGAAGLVYQPDTISAAIGDLVVFTFMSQNHTVTQSAFTTPCEKLASGTDSGFTVANINNTITPPPQMAMQVNVSTPLWFYCRQSGHCGKGMTFSINPTVNKTQAMFQAMAIAQNGTGSATAITQPAASAAVAPAAAPPAAVAPAAAAPAAASAPAAVAASPPAASVASGSGTFTAGGACDCSCLCGVAAFPQANQGIGAVGGFSGYMPMSLMAA